MVYDYHDSGTLHARTLARVNVQLNVGRAVAALHVGVAKMGCGASTPKAVQDPGGPVVADTRGVSKNAAEEAEKDKAAALIQTAAAGALESKAPAKEDPKAEPAAAPAPVAPVATPAPAPAAAPAPAPEPAAEPVPDGAPDFAKLITAPPQQKLELSATNKCTPRQEA